MRKTTRVAGVVVLLALIGACGTTREEVLGRTLQGVNAARDGFVQFDKEHQDLIVEKAETFEEGEANLRVYRDKREVVTSAFIVAYSAIAAAAIDVSDEVVFDEAINSAKDLYYAIRRFKDSLED